MQAVPGCHAKTWPAFRINDTGQYLYDTRFLETVALNTLMASLSVQLAIYSAAWLCLALGFRIKREASLLWAAAWACATVCTALVYNTGLGGFQGELRGPLLQNMMALLTLIFLQKGVERFTQHPTRAWDFVPLLLTLLAVEWLGLLGWGSYTLRVVVFTLAATWPLSIMAWHISRWVRGRALIPSAMVVVITAPVVLTLLVFWLWAVLVLLDTTGGVLDFARGSAFDVVSTLLFLLLLGAFNFSLATLVLGSLIERLRDLSTTDALTALPNRRMMMGRLAQEHARYQRSGQVYTLVTMDLDHFKRINDTHGHTVGDQVLQGVAKTLMASLRSSDTLARIGGEEFMLLMPMTDADGALVQAQRIREKVATTPLTTDAGALNMTMSLGVAEVLPTDSAAVEVFNRADAALYRAKASGRNGVEVAQRQLFPAVAPAAPSPEA